MQAKIFKSDFEEERRDRTRTRGELEVFQRNVSESKIDPNLLSARQIELDQTRIEYDIVMTELAKMEVKLKTESRNSKDIISELKNENKNLTGERDSYKKQKKGVQADLTKSKNVVEKCRKSIEVLTHKTRVLKEERKCLSEEIKGLDEQVQYYFIIPPSLHCMHIECLYYCMLARDCPDLYNRYGGEVGKV